jgi:hypothetical protein
MSLVPLALIVGQRSARSGHSDSALAASRATVPAGATTGWERGKPLPRGRRGRAIGYRLLWFALSGYPRTFPSPLPPAPIVIECYTVFDRGVYQNSLDGWPELSDLA